MFDKIYSGTKIPLLEQMAAFAERRHQLITQNIANVETPHYRAKDLDPKEFSRWMKEMVDRKGAEGKYPAEMQGTATLDRLDRMAWQPFRRTESLLRHDRNNVDMEKEMAKLAENSMMHKLALELLRKEYFGLDTAIKGKI